MINTCESIARLGHSVKLHGLRGRLFMCSSACGSMLLLFASVLRFCACRAQKRNTDARKVPRGKPPEDEHIKSFNGKFHDERLRQHWFISLADAQAIIEHRRIDYNTVRPL